MNKEAEDLRPPSSSTNRMSLGLFKVSSCSKGLSWSPLLPEDPALIVSLSNPEFYCSPSKVSFSSVASPLSWDHNQKMTEVTVTQISTQHSQGPQRTTSDLTVLAKLKKTGYSSRPQGAPLPSAKNRKASLDLSCNTPKVAAEFGVNNMKVWIYPASCQGSII